MVKIENLSNAYKEVFVILSNMEKDSVEKIPKYFIEVIKNNMNNEYEFEIDNYIDFYEQKLLKETQLILAYIFLNYFATEEQSKVIKQKLKNDITKEEKIKSEQYFNNDILKKNDTKFKIQITENQVNNKISIYNKKNAMYVIKNFIVKIKKIFNGIWKNKK